MKILSSITHQKNFQIIPEIQFYPYVGENYDSEKVKTLVLAHNRYCHPLDWEDVRKNTADPDHFADSVGEFTYAKAWYTKSFRNFLKGGLGIHHNFDENSPEAPLINDYLSKICYTNYINDFVITEEKNNVIIPAEQLERSRIINEHLLEILKPTHLICWGKEVFQYLISNPRYKTLEAKNLGKPGFNYAKIQDVATNQTFHLLKVFHPSMPGFGVYDEKTHKIFAWFNNQ